LRIRIAAIGRSRDAEIAALFRRYAGRCPWPIELVELQPRRELPDARRREAEAELLIGAVPPAARVVVLDETGRDLDSVQLAARIGAWRDGGSRDLAILIGGADGHGPAALARADLVLAMGRLTWPHELVRVMLAEQLYRAATILAGHPYHRD
jgi:23S rRNA (pseudouridine1915-N3)-methyltransferase